MVCVLAGMLFPFDRLIAAILSCGVILHVIRKLPDIDLNFLIVV
jgi:hypothetical protein